MRKVEGQKGTPGDGKRTGMSHSRKSTGSSGQLDSVLYKTGRGYSFKHDILIIESNGAGR